MDNEFTLVTRNKGRRSRNEGKKTSIDNQQEFLRNQLQRVEEQERIITNRLLNNTEGVIERQLRYLEDQLAKIRYSNRFVILNSIIFVQQLQVRILCDQSEVDKFQATDIQFCVFQRLSSALHI
jgi:hypothetical protein